MKLKNSILIAALLVSNVSQAIDLSNNILSFSSDAHRIEVFLEQSSAICVTKLDSILRGLNSANRVIVSTPKFSDCNGQERSAIISFF